MEAAGIITGAIVAVVAGMLIPFITEQWSLWAKHKSDLRKRRQELFAEYIDAQTSVHIRTAAKFEKFRASGMGGSGGPDETDNARIRAARQQLRAMFTTSDRYLLDLFNATAPTDPYLTPYSSSGLDMVLATWAAGRDIRAKRAAKKLLVEIRERKQRDERQPEDDRADAPGE